MKISELIGKLKEIVETFSGEDIIVRELIFSDERGFVIKVDERYADKLNPNSGNLIPLSSENNKMVN